jgi:acyl-CoA reductase-like NAD-dependent aldehyde dehydrogenase
MTVCIQAAGKAQKELVALPLEVRHKLISAIREIGSANAGDYGSMEFEETGLGKLEDNVKKNISACEVMGLEESPPCIR